MQWIKVQRCWRLAVDLKRASSGCGVADVEAAIGFQQLILCPICIGVYLFNVFLRGVQLRRLFFGLALAGVVAGFTQLLLVTGDTPYPRFSQDTTVNGSFSFSMCQNLKGGCIYHINGPPSFLLGLGQASGCLWTW